MTAHDKATARPWKADEATDADGYCTLRRADGTANGDTGTCLATVFDGFDAALIVQAVNERDALLARVAALEAERDRLRTMLKEAAQSIEDAAHGLENTGVSQDKRNGWAARFWAEAQMFRGAALAAGTEGRGA